MSRFDKRNFIVSTIALIVAIGSLVLTHLAISASWRIAELSGSFDRAGVEVGIGDQFLDAGRPNFVMVGASEMASVSTPIVIGAIPFTFRSSGQKSLDSLHISFQYKKIFQRQLLESAELDISGAFSNVEVRKSTSSEADQFYVSYSATDLNPGISLRIAEPIFLEETYVSGVVPFKTKDGVAATIDYGISYSKNFGMAVSAPDAAVLVYPIQVSVQQADSLQQLAGGRIQEHVLERQKFVRSGLGFMSYLVALLTSSPAETVHLVYVPLKRVDHGKDGAILFADSSQQTALVKYPLLSWRYLIARGGVQ
ncbi:hypothetical protein IB223_09005 [Pseudoxanthomonas sp. PXM03]|uniref:hypothetical protein n=1 Tax=Pseudoxanthomonas sp. PXM03 TaxID=2769284 RepID=UPI0017808E2D|nr:hypothetical protein [Pseudoxanthomonas sp. PXM03]MBD9436229.1 hypothetical protein [Pseudoxanthomonas sp. PXM03]